MVRRLQLMEPERRGLGTRLADAAAGLRDGLLRDNKFLPPILAALALIIFAWVLAGAIIGDPREERVARQAAQPSVAQAPDAGGATSEPSAPGVENRDSESLDVYESKDPFREIIPTAEDADAAAAGGDTAGGDTTGGTDGSSSGSDPSGSDGTGTGSGGGSGGTGSGDGSGGTGTGDGSGGGSGGSGSNQYGGGGGDDFLDQTSPGDPGFDNGSGGGSGSGNGGSVGGSGSDGGSGNGSGQYGGGGDGNGDLFDSGGDLGR